MTEESVGAGGDTHQLLLLHLAPFGLFLEELLPTLSLQRQLATCPLAIVHRARAIRPPRVSRTFRVEGTFSLLCRESSFPNLAKRGGRFVPGRRAETRDVDLAVRLSSALSTPNLRRSADATRGALLDSRIGQNLAVSRVDFPRGERREERLWECCHIFLEHRKFSIGRIRDWHYHRMTFVGVSGASLSCLAAHHDVINKIGFCRLRHLPGNMGHARHSARRPEVARRCEGPPPRYIENALRRVDLIGP